MKYYAHYGHHEFILCLGYRGDLIKEFFLSYNECMSNDFQMSHGGKKHRALQPGHRQLENLLRRYRAERQHRPAAEGGRAAASATTRCFLPTTAMGCPTFRSASTSTFKGRQAVASFVSVRPSQSFHRVDVDDDGYVHDIRHVHETDFRINGGFFVLRHAIFDYMRDGEELVEEPFRRLIAERRLIAHRYDGFWAAMDTFKDKTNFDNLHARGDTPWTVWKK